MEGGEAVRKSGERRRAGDIAYGVLRAIVDTVFITYSYRWCVMCVRGLGVIGKGEGVHRCKLLA